MGPDGPGSPSRTAHACRRGCFGASWGRGKSGAGAGRQSPHLPGPPRTRSAAGSVSAHACFEPLATNNATKSGAARFPPRYPPPPLSSEGIRGVRSGYQRSKDRRRFENSDLGAEMNREGAKSDRGARLKRSEAATTPLHVVGRKRGYRAW
ncbi:hypothetical protein chiPu_0011418 [Chiloscyllium punctatum]|uniref:Uncharacterized protein n=1 Tax=Chiloscyllium punctatum TaxID=137246 RepID=A0A401SRC3_CHIPU|nr:hypothetical protein [Chiloscyllium punctatum]